MIIFAILILLFSYALNRSVYSTFFIYNLYMAPAIVIGKFEIATMLMLGSVFMLCGAYFYKIIKYKGIFRKKTKDFISIGNEEKLRKFIILNFLICTGLSILYYYQIGLPILSENVGLARLESRHAVGGSYLYQRVFRVFMPILTMIYFCFLYDKRMANHFNKYIFTLMLLSTCFFLVATGIRGNLITFILIPMIILYGRVNGRIRINKAIFLTLIGLFALIVSTKLMYKDTSVLDIFYLIFIRIALLGTDGIEFMYYSYVPEYGFQGIEIYYNDFMSILYKLKIVGGEYYTFGAEIARRLLGDNYHGESAAVYYVGELYAANGYIAVFFGSILIGMVVQFINEKLYDNNKNIVQIAILSYLSSVLFMMLGGPLLSMFIDYTLGLSMIYIYYLAITRIKLFK